jgi:Ser/Thr protein kinase RdoA (MazF antagonist)
VSRLAAAHAVFTPASVGRFAAEAYHLGAIEEVLLLSTGLNDSYLVRAGGERRVLRLYRRGWRTDADVRYELDVLAHLAGKGVPVSCALPRRDGELLGHVRGPEGERQAALLTWAPGREVWASQKPEDARRYGAAVARVHAATDDFASAHARFALDRAHLVDAPLAAVLPRLGHRPDDAAFLERLGERLRRGFAELAQGLDRGFCHGDFHGGNAHTAEDGTVTFFDFDCCGPGWRAYDAAVFRWPAEWNRRTRKAWPAFLEGYRGVRAFGEADEAAVPLFVCARELWHLALHVGGGPKWGYAWNVLNDRYLDGKMRFQRRWARKHLGVRRRRPARDRSAEGGARF